MMEAKRGFAGWIELLEMPRRLQQRVGANDIGVHKITGPSIERST